MEQRTWLWRKHSNKTKTLKALKKEAERGEELEKSLRCLSEKLASLLTESDAKDNLLIKQENVAEEALAGWEKAEANAASLKEELDAALQQTDAAEEKLQELDGSLKECMQQLRAVQEEREKMIGDFRAKSLREEERAQSLEERLAEMNDKMARLIAEHNSLNDVVQAKEKTIKYLNSEKSQEEENCRMLSAKLDASEKQNGSLKYEVYMLGKELQIRNEEKDFNLKSVKAAHKQHLGSVKKITELEEECNKLRVMLRKRLPGPAAIAKMKTEVEMLNAAANSSPAKKKANLKNSGVAAKTDPAYKQLGKRELLVEKIQEMDQENKILKEELTRKNSDLQSSLLRCARTASKLSQTEKQLEELSKSSTCVTETSTPLSSDIHGLNSENGFTDDVLSSAESWASALVTELEHFRNNSKRVAPTCSTVISGINLMDDFVEMEKLASTSASNRHEESLEPMGKGPISTSDISSLSDLNGETLSSNISNESFPCRLKDTLRSIMQKHHMEQESISAILEETRVALGDVNRLANHDSANSKNEKPDAFSKSHDERSVSSKEVDRSSSSLCESTSQELQTNLDKAIFELIAVIEDIKHISLIHHIDDKAIPEKDNTRLPQEKSVTNGTEFATWSFQWKSLELKEVLESFLEVCNGLLRGNVGLEKFVGEMASMINWIIDHSTPGRESASLDRKEACPGTETDKSAVPEEVKLTIEVPLVTPDTETHQEKNVVSDKRSGHERKDDLVHSEPQSKRFNASQEFVKANQNTLSLQIELERLKEAKGLMGHHTYEQKICNGGHPDSQIPVSKSDSRKVVHSFSSLKEALECRSNNPEESLGACEDLKIQLGSAKDEERSDVFIDQDENQLTNWEISAASEKLTACQETIQNIEKQLKALAASGNSSTAPAKVSRRLGDQLLIDDTNEKARADMQLIPRTPSSSSPSTTDKAGLFYGMELSNANDSFNQVIANGSQAMQAKSPVLINSMINVDKSKDAGAGNALAIVPRKQKPRVSFWRVLLRKKVRRVVGS